MAQLIRFQRFTAAIFCSACFGFVTMSGWCNVKDDRPETQDDAVVEQGVVQWSSDLEAAKQTSNATGRPIFLLFQEIPG